MAKPQGRHVDKGFVATFIHQAPGTKPGGGDLHAVPFVGGSQMDGTDHGTAMCLDRHMKPHLSVGGVFDVAPITEEHATELGDRTVLPLNTRIAGCESGHTVTSHFDHSGL